MKRWVRVGAGLLTVALALSAGWWMRSQGQARQAAAVAAAPAAPSEAASATPATPAASATGAAGEAPPLELMPADIVAVREAPLRRVVDVSGSVQALRSALVKAKVAGEILTIDVREGEAVRAGQPLVRQDTTDLDLRWRQAQQQAIAAQAQLDIARRALVNNQALVAQGFISATALENSVSNEAAAQANLKAAQLAVDLAARARDDATLRAPMSGIVAQRLAQPGERVSVDARILEIVDLSAPEMEAAVPPEAAALLRMGATAQLRVEGIDGELNARVTRISPRAQAGSRAVLAYLSLAPHPALRQGLFARGGIEVQARQALSLPVSAVRVDRPRPYVFLLEGDRVTARHVSAGAKGRAADGDRGEILEILEGLTPGDRVLAGTVPTVAEGRRWRVAAQGATDGTPSGAPSRATPAGR